MTTHLKNKDPEAWAEVLRICEMHNGQGLSISQLTRELRHLGITCSATVRHWIRHGVVPDCRNHNTPPAVKAERRPLGGIRLRKRDPELWLEVLRVCERGAAEDRLLSQVANDLRQHGITKSSLFNWVQNGDIPHYRRVKPRRYEAVSPL